MIFFYTFQEEALHYGIDRSGAVETSNVEAVTVNVPLTRIPIADEILVNLHERFDPLKESNDHGIDLYLGLRDLVQHSLQKYIHILKKYFSRKQTGCKRRPYSDWLNLTNPW